MIIGFCGLKKHDNYNELSAIYILPDQQRKGVGQKLWEKGREFFTDNKDIIVKLFVEYKT